MTGFKSTGVVKCLVPSIEVLIKTEPRRRLTPRLTTNGPVDTGEQIAADSMARWISEHCAWTGDSFIMGLEVGTSVDIITGRSSVKLGVILDVQPRDPAEVPDVIGAGGRLTLNVISHFDMSEFEAQRRPAHELLPLFFRNAILDALEHETDECIDVDGERTFDPHAIDRGLRRDPFRSVRERSGQRNCAGLNRRSNEKTLDEPRNRSHK